MKTSCRWAAIAILGAVAALAQPQRLEITLEKQDAKGWRAVDPRLVLDPGDRVRFRARASFAGHLYVMNQSTSGQYSLLFPAEDTGRENRIEADREFVIPATEGWFRIGGPPGHEIVWWLVSPVAFEGGEPPPPRLKRKTPAMTPRCDQTILRARGACVDSSAGPQAAAEPARVPENLAKITGAASHELVFMRQKDAAVVSSPGGLAGPAIFEFRVAHR